MTQMLESETKHIPSILPKPDSRIVMVGSDFLRGTTIYRENGSVEVPTGLTDEQRNRFYRYQGVTRPNTEEKARLAQIEENRRSNQVSMPEREHLLIPISNIFKKLFGKKI